VQYSVSQGVHPRRIAVAQNIFPKPISIGKAGLKLLSDQKYQKK